MAKDLFLGTPASAGAATHLRVADQQESGKPKRWERVCFENNQRSFVVGKCKVTPLKIEVHTESHSISVLRAIFRYKIDQALWDGLTNERSGVVVPGTSTEVRRVPGIPTRSAVVLTHAQSGIEMTAQDIPLALQPFVRQIQGGFYGEDLPQGLLLQLEQSARSADLTHARSSEFSMPSKDVVSEKLSRWSVPAAGRNLQFPGGPQALADSAFPVLERSMQRLEVEYGPLRTDDVKIHWNGKERGAAVIRLMQLEWDNKGGKKFFAKLRADLFLSTNPSAKLRRHELSHIYFDPTLPLSESIFEAVAGNMEMQLREADDEENVRWRVDAWRLALRKPVILSGAPGWGMEGGATSYDHENHASLINAGHSALLLEICDGDPEVLKRILLKSKESYDKRPVVMKNNERHIQRPALSEWLEDMDTAVPGFRQKYLQSELHESIPEGNRLVWYPHHVWGGILSPQSFRKNPQFGSRGTESDVCVGSMENAKGFVARITFSNIPNKQGDIQLGHQIDFEPLRVAEMYRGLEATAGGSELLVDPSKLAQSPAVPPRGTKLTIRFPGTQIQPLEVIWNEDADRYVQDLNGW